MYLSMKIDLKWVKTSIEASFLQTVNKMTQINTVTNKLHALLWNAFW